MSNCITGCIQAEGLGTLLKNTISTYGTVSVLVHWLSALLAFGLFGLGLYMVELSYYDPLYHELPEWHKSLGAALAVLTLFRIFWRMATTTPELLTKQPSQIFAARVAHALLLLFLLLLPITGYLIVTAEGKALLLFDLALLPAWLELTPEQTDWVGRLHLWSAWGLIGLALGHSVAALKHHFIDADRTLIRMVNIKGQ